MNQRWRNKLDSYREPSERINPSAYEVAELPGDKLAKAFVTQHHYSGSYPAARFRFGLYRAAELVGVAVFSHPMRDDILTSCFPGEARDSAELGRFVLLDSVPGNGETWFLARCFSLLRGRLRGVISFSDPYPRSNAEGAVVFGGHLGTIYQAHNAVYLGRGYPRSLRLFPDGSVFSPRAMQKIRAVSKGFVYASTLLVRYGAEPLGEQEEPAEWFKIWNEKLTRSARRLGNHKYVWGFGKADKKRLAELHNPYPKQKDKAA